MKFIFLLPIFWCLLALITPLQAAPRLPSKAAKQAMKDHWAWKAPVRPSVLEAAGAGAGASSVESNPIDAFILARLAKEGLNPSPPADKVTLLRRLYLDLIGLPPTLEQVDGYVDDTSPDAYQKVVEELLKSPHYGERQGRHWLDAARYADSDGFEKDKARFIWSSATGW